MEYQDLSINGTMRIPIAGLIPASVDPSHEGRLLYIIAEKKLYYCDGVTWKEIINDSDVDQNFTGHIADITNPHDVTATQVGVPATIDGITNPGGDIGLVEGAYVDIAPDSNTNNITIGINPDLQNKVVSYESHLVDFINPHVVTASQTHATSGQGSVNNSGNTVIQDIVLDTYGHITGLTSNEITSNVVFTSTTGSGTGGTTLIINIPTSGTWTIIAIGTQHVINQNSTHYLSIDGTVVMTMPYGGDLSGTFYMPFFGAKDVTSTGNKTIFMDHSSATISTTFLFAFAIKKG